MSNLSRAFPSWLQNRLDDSDDDEDDDDSNDDDLDSDADSFERDFAEFERYEKRFFRRPWEPCPPPPLPPRPSKKARTDDLSPSDWYTDHDPRQSNWYTTYVDSPQRSARFHKTFKTRFRTSYDDFLQLKNEISQLPEFAKWGPGSTDRFGAEFSPIDLLLLGALRRLARRWTFDDSEESTFITSKCHQIFFHQFDEYRSTKGKKTGTK